MIPEPIINSIIKDMVGEDVVPIVHLMMNKPNISEFKFAEKLSITINQVRNMLYRLSTYDIVDFTRKRDKESGWYIYFWTLNLPKLRDLSVKTKKGLIVQLENSLQGEKNNDFFICPDRHIRVSLTNAMEYNFKCPECGLNLSKEDNKKIIDTIEKRISKLKEEIGLLEKLEIKPLTEKKKKLPQKKLHKKIEKRKFKIKSTKKKKHKTRKKKR